MTAATTSSSRPKGSAPRFDAEPLVRLRGQHRALVAQGSLSSYLSLRRATTAWCSPRAARSAASSAATLEDIPATRRFFLGGGGSIRGYEYRTVGPSIDGEVVGGLSFWETSLEAPLPRDRHDRHRAVRRCRRGLRGFRPGFLRERAGRRGHRPALLYVARAAPLRCRHAAQSGGRRSERRASMSDWDSRSR